MLGRPNYHTYKVIARLQRLLFILSVIFFVTCDQRCRILFFPWKRYWATHSLLFEICGIFFFRIRKKKYSPKISDYSGLGQWTLVNPTKMTKKWSDGLHFRKNTNPHHVIGFFCHKNGYRGFTKRIFFSEKVGSGKKKIPRFSLTHSFFEISFLKVSFPGKKKKYDTFEHGTVFFVPEKINAPSKN